MFWKGTHLSIKGLRADNAYQSEKQTMRSKELPAELRDRIVSRHRSGEGYKKKFCCTEGSQEHSDFHNSQMEEVWLNQDSSKSWSPNQTEQLMDKGLV
jgi:hypothetical protein